MSTVKARRCVSGAGSHMTAEKRDKIRKVWADNPDMSYATLGIRFGVNRATIASIILGKQQ